jgi:hypothetical protein
LSAILKALRKIERESSGEIQTPSFSKNLDAKKAIHQRARKAWLLRRLASVFIPVLVLGAIIGLAFAFKPFYFGRNPFFSPVSQVHGEEQKAAGPPAPEQRREYGQAPERAFKAQTAPGENTVSEPSTGASAVKDRPAVSRTSSEAGIPHRDAGMPSLPAETRSQAEPVPVLELQAVVWSDDPRSCFAVINGRIVRSGGMVDGVSVLEVGKDSVSLKLGDRTWTLRILEGD